MLAGGNFFNTSDTKYVLKLKLFSLQQQARRVYEILRLRITDLTDVNMYRDYRIDIKNRLNIPYQVNHVLLYTFFQHPS